MPDRVCLGEQRQAGHESYLSSLAAVNVSFAPTPSQVRTAYAFPFLLPPKTLLCRLQADSPLKVATNFYDFSVARALLLRPFVDKEKPIMAVQICDDSGRADCAKVELDDVVRSAQKPDKAKTHIKLRVKKKDGTEYSAFLLLRKGFGMQQSPQ
jgi:hypothetical protein